jgi:hypothetical protein
MLSMRDYLEHAQHKLKIISSGRMYIIYETQREERLRDIGKLML